MSTSTNFPAYDHNPVRPGLVRLPAHVDGQEPRLCITIVRHDRLSHVALSRSRTPVTAYGTEIPTKARQDHDHHCRPAPCILSST